MTTFREMHLLKQIITLKALEHLIVKSILKRLC